MKYINIKNERITKISKKLKYSFIFLFLLLNTYQVKSVEYSIHLPEYGPYAMPSVYINDDDNPITNFNDFKTKILSEVISHPRSGWLDDL
ncbi:hypothetical protein K9M16_03935 [Candidatus Babeliales bacterium]|nr:hypothetical protein [Candidatus Babeliales bacterium]